MRGLGLCVVLLGIGCGCGAKQESGLAGLDRRTVKLPNGGEVRAEVAIRPFDLQRGLMFRDAVPRGTGMLFIHDRPGAYSYYMYQVRIPLDIIWLDSGQRVVEISANTPPCNSKASQCPTYGGHARAQFVLELGGGEAARNGLNVGDRLLF
ncbi:MAG: DUF192 domain-containing protein [Acidobacteria bacterium]|nr:DUF192 domain-containing protein [Acidobacteriota bacterium]